MSMTVKDLRRLVAEFDMQADTNEDELVVLQDEEGAESVVSEGVIMGGVLFLHPVRLFMEEEER